MRVTIVKVGRTIPLGGGEFVNVEIETALQEGDSPGAMAGELLMEVNANILPAMAQEDLTPRGQVAMVAATRGPRPMHRKLQVKDRTNGEAAGAKIKAVPQKHGTAQTPLP